MPKRLATALLALVTFAPALAVAAASPAAAHDLYHYANQHKQRCAYDPFAGSQCWTETVSVRVPSHHSHAQVCPAGTTGTHPNCYPIPPTNGPAPTTPQDWTDPEPVDADPVDADPVDADPVDADPVDPDPVDPGTGTGTTYTVKPCTPWQDSLESYQRHRHPLGGGADSGCHRHDSSHCPAGQTEQGGHGLQDCRKNDSADNIVTRTQHLIEQGTQAALRQAIDAVKSGLEQQGQSGLINAEGTVEIGKTITETWDSLPQSVKSFVKTTGCGLVASLAVVSIYASAGATAPGWATWSAGVGGAAYCGGVIHDAIEWVGDRLDTDSENDNESGGAHPGGTDGEQEDSGAPPADPSAPDPGDWSYDNGENARYMCATYNEPYFCKLVADYGQNGGQ